MNTIENADITADKLAEVLGAAAIACEPDKDGDLYLTDGLSFPVWLKYQEKAKRIKLFTFLKAKEGVSRETLVNFAHELNDDFVTVRFTASTYDDGRAFLNGDYFLYTAFGLVIPQLVETIRRFSDIFIDAIRKKDPDDTITA